MSIQERKYSVIEKIMHLNENDLDKIEAILQDEIELNDALDKSLQQVKEGKVTYHSQIRKKYEKWL
ncbi:hypothetical protein [Ekhidna lutea]|uniref:hypothetical protein n=1 Tax=Ekhidna lutea TaxID=447679 RepID=UPI000B77AA20|nr:hypothetical protein [Ekhidna lutea]